MKQSRKAAGFFFQVVGVCFALSCGPRVEKPACAPEALVAIELAYLQEAEAACQGYTFDDCPALPAIRERFRAKRAEWEACQ